MPTGGRDATGPQQPAAAAAGVAAAEALGPEVGLLAGFGSVDPVGFGQTLTELGAALVARPAPAFGAAGRFGAELVQVGWAVAARALGKAPRGPRQPADGDRRFRDPAWERNPWFFGLQQAYLAWAGFMHELVDAADLKEHTAKKADYVVGLLVEALAPTNLLWSNPAALRRAFESGGRSVVAGLRNVVHDAANNGGKPSQVDLSAFHVGDNLAATPGQVVFRNDLMELIQYAPQTETVFEVPLLLSPPWINKDYIMDLAPGRSFAEWAVTHGHTVFAISYCNPDESMRHVALDDYLLHGPRTALQVITEITGSEQVNMVGLCLGGTLTTMLLAHLAATGDPSVRSATLLNTLVDFTEPGPMGHFLGRASVEHLNKRMLRRGYLDSTEMATMFDLLRARDLVWNYVVSGWLMGEQPPAFDILAWNADGTRMPADMHSFYLRCCYLDNELARGKMSLAGTRLDLGQVTSDIYLLSAKEDHIAPWRSSYAGTTLLGGATRFVLSAAGHIAGIVNPPGSRRVYWTNEDLPADPAAWLAGATEHAGSWWQDWADWIATRAGARRPPPPMGSTANPPLAGAPGSYVHQR